MGEGGVRIVFIGGYARTGSTLLDRLLGQMDGFVSLGELRRVWDRCFLGNQLCGCGRPFHECPFWQGVADRAFGGFDGVDAKRVLQSKTSVDNFWHIPRILSGGWTAGYRRRMRTYQQALQTLYAAIRDESGARYLIDSTKDPQHAYILRTIPGFDVRVLHLVRDSRAVAHSWRRIRRRPEIYWRDQNMARFPVTRTALAWDLTNAATEGLRTLGQPYAMVRYEDLIAEAAKELDRACRELRLGPVDLSFLQGGTVELAPSHTVAGNPGRFEVGPIALRADDEWRSQMSTLDRSIVTVLSWPLLRRYGYRPSADLPGSTPERSSAAGAGPAAASADATRN